MKWVREDKPTLGVVGFLEDLVTKLATCVDLVNEVQKRRLKTLHRLLEVRNGR